MKKEKEKHFLIGIDTAQDKRFSYIVYGPLGRINQLEKDIEYICLKNGIKKIHFNDIRPDKRKKIYPEIIKSVLKYDGISYNVLEHVRPEGYPAKDFYLTFLPRIYSERFSFLNKENGIIRIEIHEDFNVPGVKNSTDYFLNSLIRQITDDLIKKSENKKIFRDRGIFYSTIKCKDTNCILKFNLRKLTRQESNAINVADIVLGFHQLSPFGLLEDPLYEKRQVLKQSLGYACTGRSHKILNYKIYIVIKFIKLTFSILGKKRFKNKILSR
jgi:hypothetical protein